MESKDKTTNQGASPELVKAFERSILKSPDLISRSRAIEALEDMKIISGHGKEYKYNAIISSIIEKIKNLK